MMRRICALAAAGVIAVVAATLMHDDTLSAQANDGVITGAVTSGDGAEAGVWVIAETDDLETVFRKIRPEWSSDRTRGSDTGNSPSPSRIGFWYVV